MVRIGFLLFFAFTIAGIPGCGSSEGLTELSVEERFEKARALFNEEDYLDAINEFRIITLQYQGSAYADDAQFYLGESLFRRGEYHLAALEYAQLKNNMPASPFVAEAQYKLGLCYYNLSPKSELDQQYTLRARDELQAFVDDYAGSEYAVEAEEKIKELTSRLAKKEYDAASLYATMGYNRSAVLVYDIVIEKYPDTEYAPLAHLGKVEALIARKKYQEAGAALSKFLQLYPDSVLRSRAERLRELIEQEVDSNSLSGKESGTSQPEVGSVL